MWRVWEGSNQMLAHRGLKQSLRQAWEKGIKKLVNKRKARSEIGVCGRFLEMRNVDRWSYLKNTIDQSHADVIPIHYQWAQEKHIQMHDISSCRGYYLIGFSRVQTPFNRQERSLTIRSAMVDFSVASWHSTSVELFIQVWRFELEVLWQLLFHTLLTKMLLPTTNWVHWILLLCSFNNGGVPHVQAKGKETPLMKLWRYAK